MKPAKSDIIEAAAILKRGGAVVFPTDTAYGLAVDATNRRAVDYLYELKGITHTKPALLIFPNMKELARVVEFDKTAKALAGKYWPGPLTMVLKLKSKAKIWDKLGAGTGTLGVRNPDCPAALLLAKTLDRPITATSANLTGEPAVYTVKEVKADFSKSVLKPDYYLDGGRLKKVLPSTIVRIDKNSVQLVREGPIKFSEIKQQIK